MEYYIYLCSYFYSRVVAQLTCFLLLILVKTTIQTISFLKLEILILTRNSCMIFSDFIATIFRRFISSRVDPFESLSGFNNSTDSIELFFLTFLKYNFRIPFT